MSSWSIEKQIACYGVTEESLNAQVLDAINPMTLKNGSTFMLQLPSQVVTSMLSDVQELIARGESEQARQRLNCAKHVLIHKITMPERDAERALVN